MNNFFILLLALTILFASSAHAQTPTKEIQSLSVVIEDLDADARKCGITESSLRTTAEYLLEGAGIPVSDAHTNPFIYIAPTVLAEHRQDGSLLNCTAYIQVQLLGSVFSQPPLWGNGILVYFSTSGIASASADHFGAFSKEHVEEMVKKIIIDIKKAQH